MRGQTSGNCGEGTSQLGRRSTLQDSLQVQEVVLASTPGLPLEQEKAKAKASPPGLPLEQEQDEHSPLEPPLRREQDEERPSQGPPLE